MKGPAPDDRIRLAELIASLSLATDLGLGQPLERELGICLGALELADRLDCGAEERSEVYYVALLAHVGCTAAAPYLAGWVGGDEIRFQRGAQVLDRLVELIPRVGRETIDGAAHVPQLTMPERYVEITTRAVQRAEADER